VEDAFQTQLHTFRYLDNGAEKTYRGRTGYVQLPSELADIVEGVFGLDNRPQAIPFVRFQALPELDDRRFPGHLADFYEGITSFYKFPVDFSAREQCIGIIEFGGGFYQADVRNFFSQCCVSSRTVNVVLVGADNKTTFGDNRDLEVALDIELAGVFAPDATIVAYFAPPTEKGWVDAIGNAVHDSIHHPSCLSISWGYTEASDHWTRDCISAVNSIFQDAALFGVTVCTASGDAGPEFQGNLAQVNFPASSPFALSCGGTMIDSGWPPTSETVWKVSDAASGGGISDLARIPRWQNIVRPPSVVLPRAVPQFAGRMLPDVAALANDYSVLFNNNKWADACGTSAAAPLWAALIARINEALLARGVSSTVGYLNPLLYQSLQKHEVCTDIISGNNSVNGGAGYAASKGWDACTGWGTPIGNSLLQSLI
jgi:kumamolisin